MQIVGFPMRWLNFIYELKVANQFKTLKKKKEKTKNEKLEGKVKCKCKSFSKCKWEQKKINAMSKSMFEFNKRFNAEEFQVFSKKSLPGSQKTTELVSLCRIDYTLIGIAVFKLLELLIQNFVYMYFLF